MAGLDEQPNAGGRSCENLLRGQLQHQRPHQWRWPDSAPVDRAERDGSELRPELHPSDVLRMSVPDTERVHNSDADTHFHESACGLAACDLDHALVPIAA